MKKGLLFVFLFLSSSYLQAEDCQILLPHAETSYCLSLIWQEADYWRQDSPISSGEQSPQWVVARTPSAKKLYSVATVKIWLAQDPEQSSVKIENFTVFPYMAMMNGHHHGTSYRWEWIEAQKVYVLSKVVFAEMPGCWSLRWTFDPEGLWEDSFELLQITQYANLSEQENRQVKGYCDRFSSSQ